MSNKVLKMNINLETKLTRVRTAAGESSPCERGAERFS
jgi:hypothetical protein